MIYQFSNQTNMVDNPTIPQIFKVRGYPWISFGEANIFPSYVTELYNKSAINRRALQAKSIGVFGSGLMTKDPEKEDLLFKINPKESWNDVFEKICMDYEIYGGVALNIIWEKSGERINSIYHMPFPSIRSGEWDPKLDGVNKYYYSSDWKRFKKHTPIEYQAFDPSKAKESPSQVLYFFDYNPDSVYYPLPSYAGSLQDINIDIETSNFHLSNLANGLNPSLFVSFHNGIPDPAKEKEFYDAMANAFAGTENTGKFFMSFSDDKEHAPEVTPIESANDDYYIQLESRITTRILSGHGLSSPLLLGIQHAGGNSLGSNKDEILIAYQHFQSTVLNPDIRALLKLMDKLMFYYSGEAVKLYVKPLELFPPEDASIEIQEATK